MLKFDHMQQLTTKVFKVEFWILTYRSHWTMHRTIIGRTNGL